MRHPIHPPARCHAKPGRAECAGEATIVAGGDTPALPWLREREQEWQVWQQAQIQCRESFLVSLALALAVSDLVSHKTSIDSLFLDEGFGTLDGETLEVALDALDSLNAGGKMIGIISHVEALKERIPVQLRVHKAPGMGYSMLDKAFAVGH